jgi:hypothetical protein
MADIEGVIVTPIRSEASMIALALILLVLWILGFAVFHVAGVFIHLLLVAAVIVVLYRIITGRRPVV